MIDVLVLFALFSLFPLLLFCIYLYLLPLFSAFLCSFSDVGSVEGLAYHRGWDMLYWTSYTTSTITRHSVDQSRWGAVQRQTVVTMSGDDHPRAFVLDECQGLELPQSTLSLIYIQFCFCLVVKCYTYSHQRLSRCPAGSCSGPTGMSSLPVSCVPR